MLDINNKIHEIDLINDCFIPCLFIGTFHRYLQIKAVFFTDMFRSYDAVCPSYTPMNEKNRPKKLFCPNIFVFLLSESSPFPDKGKSFD